MSIFRKNLFLVRHGETECNEDNIVEGQIDSPLTQIGRRQAEDVAERAKELGIHVLLSSDLSRAVDTARVISGAIGIPIIDTNPVYRERYYGEIEGKRTDELKIIYPEYVTKDGKFILEYDFPKAETINEFYSRAISGIFGLIEQFKDEKVMLVTHKGVLNMVYAYMNSVPLQVVRTVYNPENCIIENY